VILYDNDIAMISNIISLVYKFHPNNIILVRTKVDQYKPSHARSIEDEKILDRRNVIGLLGVELPLYFVSSHNVTSGKELYDWIPFTKDLLS
jgi:hypothetical protein